LLPVLGLLYLSERFQWLPFSENKGWTVLIVVAVICVAVVLLLLWCGISLVLRRRFQFSIRSLLLLVLAVAVACSWLAVEMRRAERQKDAVEAIRAADAAQIYDYDSPETEPPTWLRELFGDDFFGDRIWWVFMSEQSGDEDLERVSELSGLKILICQSHGVTDAGVEHLKGAAQLEVLDLNGTQVTDAGLVYLKGLTNLRVLCVGGTSVTEEGVRKLREALPDCEIEYCRL